MTKKEQRTLFYKKKKNESKPNQTENEKLTFRNLNSMLLAKLFSYRLFLLYREF